MGSRLQVNKASSTSPISWHGESDMGVHNENKTISHWPNEEKGANFLDILELAEKEASKKSDMMRIADKSDFLKRMSLDKYSNIGDLDKLCVYQMKRKLVETVIEEQYAMDNTEGEKERSVPLLVQVGAVEPDPLSLVDKAAKSPVAPSIEKAQSYFDKIIMDQFEKKDTDSDMEDVFIDVDDSGIPDSILWRQSGKRKDEVNSNVAKFVSEMNDMTPVLNNNTKVNESVKPAETTEFPERNFNFSRLSPQLQRELKENDTAQDEIVGQQGQNSPRSPFVSQRDISSPVSPSSSTRTPTSSPKSDSHQNTDTVTENQPTDCCNSPKNDFPVSENCDIEHVDVVTVADLAKSVIEVVPDGKNELCPSKSPQTQSIDSLQNRNEHRQNTNHQMLRKDSSQSKTGIEASCESPPITKNVPLVQNLSGTMLHSRHHEPIRRQRGRRKPHLPLQCRKRTYFPEKDVHLSPPSHQLGPLHHAKHPYTSWPPGVPSTESIEPYSLLNYMYQYTSNTPGNPPQNSYPVSMAMSSALPLISTYPLSLNSQMAPSQLPDGQPSIEAMQYFSNPENTDSVIPGMQSTRPPFASHRYDAACDQYPAVLNKLFHQMCSGTGQPLNVSEKNFPPSSYSNSGVVNAVPKQTETTVKEHTVVPPTSKESTQNNQTLNTNSKKDSSSNDELTQYFNLLFNPSYSRPTDRIGHRKTTIDSGSSLNTQQTKETESSPARSSQQSSQECSKVSSPTKILAAIDLTNDDSPESASKEAENDESAATHSGMLPININDEMWSVSVASKPGSSDSDPIVIDCGTPSEDTSQDSAAKAVQPVKPYEPKFFQSLPQSDIDKMSLLESLKKWTVNEVDATSQGRDGDLGGQGHDVVDGQGGGDRVGEGENVEKEKVEDSESEKDDGVKKSEKMIPVLDAMNKIISGLLDRGAIDLSLATKSANKLFSDKFNGVTTTCNCSYRKRPAQMSRSMAARANALTKAALKQGQPPPGVVRASAVPTALPMRSPHRSQVVFPEMIHQEQQRLANKSKEVSATLSKPPPSPPKKAVKMPTSTIKHYGPMQMIGGNFAKPSKDQQSFSSTIEPKSADVANAFQQTPRFVYGNLGQCLDMQAQALLGKSRQIPFMDYSPLGMFPANAHAMYNEYLLSQKRSLEALQGTFCLPPPLPLKRQRIVFGDEGGEANGQPLCSV